jgi:hypothetical protein
MTWWILPEQCIPEHSYWDHLSPVFWDKASLIDVPDPDRKTARTALNYTVSPVRACLSKWLERFRKTQKEDDRGPLSIQSDSILSGTFITSIQQYHFQAFESGWTTQKKVLLILKRSFICPLEFLQYTSPSKLRETLWDYLLKNRNFVKALAKMGSLPRKSILKNSKDGLLSAQGDQVSNFPPLFPRQRVTKRCRLSWLTNGALVYEPKCGGGGLPGLSQWVTAVHMEPK